MLATYRGPDDPPAVVKSLAARLMVEPRRIAIACCDPTHGLVTEIFVKPTVADIARWCERQAEEAHTLIADDNRRWREERDKAEAEREAAAKRENRPTIEELRARYGPTFGLKGIDEIDRARGIGHNVDDDTEEAIKRKAEETRRAFEVSNAMIHAEYMGLGALPHRAKGEMLVSPSLMAILGKPVKCKLQRKRQRAAK